jgi:cell division protease FtsH
VDLDVVARATPGFSGADLANVVNEAAMHAARRGGEEIRRADVDAALDKVMLGDRRELRLADSERRRVAVHEAGHAVVASHVGFGNAPRRVSIIPRGMSLGSTLQRPEDDRYLAAQPELEAKLAVFMGGHAAERMLLGDVSTGAEDDLRKATEIARRMVANYGMSDAIGPVFHDLHRDHPFLGRTVAGDAGVSDASTHLVESEARRILLAARERADQLLVRHRATLERLIERLLEDETLEDEGLDDMLGAAPSSERRASVPLQVLHARAEDRHG